MIRTQHEIFYAEQARIGRLNEAFMDMVRDGLSRAELATLIARRPEKYERFAGFLETLA